MSLRCSGRPTLVETKNLATLYDLPMVEWSRITRRLEAGITQAPGTGGPDRHTCWLATLNPDGSPHVAGIGAEWHDATFWFETGGSTVKGRNLTRDPRCSISLATDEYDLIVRGEAHRVVDPTVVAELAALWREGGWPAEVDESGIALTAPFSAPSAGPPPWFVYRVTIEHATELTVSEPSGATSWSF